MLCPYCAEEIKDDAIKCKHCGEWLNKEPANLIGIAKGAMNSLMGAHDKVFGSNEIIDPKDDSPLIIDNKLTLYGTYFFYENTKLKYEDVYDLSFSSKWDTVNFIGTGDTILSFNCYGFNRGICLIAHSGVLLFKIKGKIQKMIVNAYHVLSIKSFTSRFNRYMNQIENQGYISYYSSIHHWKINEAENDPFLKEIVADPDVRKAIEKAHAEGPIKIFPNGILQKGTKRINLKTAYKEGIFGLEGSALYGYKKYERNPYEMLFSEKKGFFEKNIALDVAIDNDVMREIILQLATS